MFVDEKYLQAGDRVHLVCKELVTSGRAHRQVELQIVNPKTGELLGGGGWLV